MEQVVRNFERNARWLWLFAGCVALSAALWGCSPTYNWREVRPEGTSLKALFPCKPESASRPVNMGGRDVVLNMLSCDVNQHTFALAAMRLPQGAQAADMADVALSLKKATLASMKAQSEQDKPWAPGVALGVPFHAWQAHGLRHDGSAVQAHVLYFSRGSDLFQAAVYGPAQADVLTTWADGLKLDALP